jgi:hypothetical protein
MAHLSILPHAFAIGLYAPYYRLPVHFAGEAHRSSRNDDACGKPLDVPLPWTWERLVKVIEIEDLVSFWCCVDSEVVEVRITAELDADA